MDVGTGGSSIALAWAGRESAAGLHSRRSLTSSLAPTGTLFPFSFHFPFSSSLPCPGDSVPHGPTVLSTLCTVLQRTSALISRNRRSRRPAPRRRLPRLRGGGSQSRWGLVEAAALLAASLLRPPLNHHPRDHSATTRLGENGAQARRDAPPSPASERTLQGSPEIQGLFVARGCAPSSVAVPPPSSLPSSLLLSSSSSSSAAPLAWLFSLSLRA